MSKMLNSINDLVKISDGDSVSKHSLILLYWFAKTIHIDDWDNMRLTFDVNRGDCGSHWYGNYEHMLEPLPSGYNYYTIGNLYKGHSSLLLNYVVNPPRTYEGNNRDRIIVRVQRGGETIDQVYITQHASDPQWSSYDARCTYRISPTLIKQLRRLNVNENQMPHLRELLRSEGNNFQTRPSPDYQCSCLLVLIFLLVLVLFCIFYFFGKHAS